MKKLNKVLAILCTGAIAVSGIAAFSACGGGHDHNAHLTYVSDGATQHHGECTEDDYKTEKENHTWGANNKCTKCGEDKPAEVNVTLDKSTASVEVGKAVTINVTVTGSTAAVTATSGTPANATVSVNGKVVTVTGVKAGTSVITVSCGGVSKTCTVTVTAPAEASLSHEIAILEDGGSELNTLEITVKNAEGAVTADTADHEVATAAYASGKVTLTAVGTGKTELTVSVGGKELKCPVEVATYGLKYGVGEGIMIVEDTEARTSKDVYVPGYFYDEDEEAYLPVTELLGGVKNSSGGWDGNGAFTGSDIETIYVGDNVTVIGANSFRGCKSLTTVVCGPELKTIDGYAFDGTDVLNSVDLSKSTKLETITRCAFSACGLTSIEIPESVTFIGDSCFNGAQKLATIKINSTNLDTLFGSTFMQCLALSEIWLPALTTSGNLDFYCYSDRTANTITVHYAGTRAQWDTYKNSLENATILETGLTVICSDDAA